MANKVKYNLKNVYVARILAMVDGEYEYDTPKAVPGAVSMALTAEGSVTPFYADGIVYFRTSSNNGYSGDLEMALLPDWFRTEILREEKDANGVLLENGNLAEPVHFALLFEFDGDQKAIRHALYNVSVSSRPSLESQTRTETIEPVTETLSLAADAREDGLVKARTGDDTAAATYADWYKAVYTPVMEPGAEPVPDPDDNGG